MSDTPRWNNLPEPARSAPITWTGFTIDPRVQPGLRAANSDREHAAALVADAFATGRLDAAERDDRLATVAGAKTLGELVPVLTDLALPAPIPPSFATPTAPAAPEVAPAAAQPTGPLWRRMPAWWVRLSVIFIAIWLLTMVTSGHWLYFWPIWPMLGTAIPAILGQSSRASQPVRSEPEREQLPPGPADLR